jgi:hypothetical protein
MTTENRLNDGAMIMIIDVTLNQMSRRPLGDFWPFFICSSHLVLRTCASNIPTDFPEAKWVASNARCVTFCLTWMNTESMRIVFENNWNTSHHATKLLGLLMRSNWVAHTFASNAENRYQVPGIETSSRNNWRSHNNKSPSNFRTAFPNRVLQICESHESNGPNPTPWTGRMPLLHLRRRDESN